MPQLLRALIDGLLAWAGSYNPRDLLTVLQELCFVQATRRIQESHCESTSFLALYHRSKNVAATACQLVLERSQWALCSRIEDGKRARAALKMLPATSTVE